jgi:hypothetical protein
LTTFSKVYSETWEQKADQENLKNVQYGKTRSRFKVVEKKDMAAKQNRAIRKKSCTLHWNSKKDALRLSQELTRFHPWEDQWHEKVKLSERVSLENRAPQGHDT